MLYPYRSISSGKNYFWMRPIIIPSPMTSDAITIRLERGARVGDWVVPDMVSGIVVRDRGESVAEGSAGFSSIDICFVSPAERSYTPFSGTYPCKEILIRYVPGSRSGRSSGVFPEYFPLTSTCAPGGQIVCGTSPL